ncbi:MAG: hypothetical protein OXQ94_11125 [Gemmatimonadota bacterium]|nr:hypothetical protein [Gemmatimonadota bacterium]MDE2872221.1 hypothetical protein [Gemmatimonadota bacterium]
MDMRVLAVTVITDQCLPDALEEADVPTIIATARAAEPRLARLVKGVLGGPDGGRRSVRSTRS